jgi:hypothetical protein
MWQKIGYSALVAGTVLALAGCGFADSHSPVPEFMRARASAPPPPEPQPDVGRLVRDNLDSVFVAASYPRAVRVSAPHHKAQGPGWIACVKAELTSVMGKPLGTETYLVTISGGVIGDRRRAETDDNCASETYRPIRTVSSESRPRTQSGVDTGSREENASK